jgi:hypothetical protein
MLVSHGLNIIVERDVLKEPKFRTVNAMVLQNGVRLLINDDNISNIRFWSKIMALYFI